MAVIKFGTSGWREIIARDFTFDNVRLATQAIADYLKAESGKQKAETILLPRVEIPAMKTVFLPDCIAA